MATSASPQTGIYYAQHVGRGTTLVVDNDGVLDMSSGTARLPAVLRQGVINFGLNEAWEVSSADSLNALTSGTNPSIGRINAGTDPAWRIRWASGAGNADPVQFNAFMPPDVSTAPGMTISVYGEGSSANAENKLNIAVFFGVGDANAGASGGQLTSSPTLQSITVASGDIITNVPVTVVLTPSSAHASGPIDLYGLRAVYTKVTS